MTNNVVMDMGQRLGPARLGLILLLNLIPVGGVLWLAWDAGQILMLYWIENVIIGVLALLRILTAREREPPQSGASTGPLRVGCFFIFHYGLFTLIHGVFTMILAARLIGDGGDLWRRVFANPTFHWAVFGVAGVQVVILFREWWASGLWRRSTPFMEMFRPYGPVVVLHMTVLGAAWWMSETAAPVRAVLILCLMKAVVELAAAALFSPREA